ncbi:MAG: ATP-binding protein [Deltaproteobacteria bacterium]|nr:MAG: ATP-binding protein [Deltaproteobacteria bacterium]
MADGIVTIRLLVGEELGQQDRWSLEDAVADASEAIEGVREARVTVFVRGHEEASAPPGAPAGAAAAAASSGPAAASGGGASPVAEKAGGRKPLGSSGGGAAATPGTLEGVGRVIAVASGKGGVGKSTVAVNLALALQRQGYRVGLLDIDVYGPSLPTLLGVNERPNVHNRRIVPLVAEGMKLMSLGYLMEDDTPVIWRGPIVTGIIRQFLQDVDWSGTDYLIVDMPPGTGDAQLSLAQSVPVDGAVIVTTPSDLALIDAARGLHMFETLNVDVLGIVENMSWFAWPGAPALRSIMEDARATAPEIADRIEAVLDEHERTWIFGRDGGQREAERLGAEFLGRIPLDPEVRRGGDEGRPVVAAAPESPVSEAFLGLARRIAEARPLETGDSPDAGKRKGLFSFMKS